jgi:glycosyltransferase involved in cell wall biosynthesis
VSNLSIVIPCYNEQEVLTDTTEKLLATLSKLIKKKKVSPGSKIYLVDDGSKDDTWKIIERTATNYEMISGIKLSKNSGHQNALMAGLLIAEGDAVISMDADLQDDISVIEKMIDEYQRGSAIVYGVRQRRGTDTIFKKFSAETFYKMIRIAGVDIIHNHADYRLMSRFAINCLKEFKERNLFLRGIVPLIGLETSKVYYERRKREKGKTKYPLRKMLAFAWEGITSFSILPLRFISFVGIFLSFCSIGISIWVLWIKFIAEKAIPGWASLLLPLSVISAVQLLSLGMLGEYIGKIYKETKRRPRYFIEKIIQTNKSL